MCKRMLELPLRETLAPIRVPSLVPNLSRLRAQLERRQVQSGNLILSATLPCCTIATKRNAASVLSTLLTSIA